MGHSWVRVEMTTFSNKDIQLFSVMWGIVESLWCYECLSACYGGLSTEGGWVDDITHTKINDLVTNDNTFNNMLLELRL